MDQDEVPYHFIDSLSFSIYGLAEIQKIAVLEITNPLTFDTLGHPTKGGLHDPLLGPVDFGEVCESCGLNNVQCPGHLAYISFPMPVFNPVFFRTLYAILKGSCFNCHRLLAAPWMVQLTQAQLKLLDLGLTGPVQELEEIANEAINMASGEAVMGNVSVKTPSMLSLIVKDKLDLKLQEIQAGLESGTTMDEYSVCVKNVVECRHRMIKNFIRDHLSKGAPVCPHCRSPRVAVSIYQNTRFIFGKKRGVKRKIETALKSKLQRVRPEDILEVPGEEEEEEDGFLSLNNSKEQTFLTPQSAQKHLHELWKNEGPFLSKLFGILSSTTLLRALKHESPVDIFFMDALLVAPSRFRPLAFMRGQKYENPQTATLSKVLQASLALRDIILYMKTNTELPVKSDGSQSYENISKLIGKSLAQKLLSACTDLQAAVNAVVDSDLDKLNSDKTPGVKQIIEKKEGLFRKHMMGKRVNYACRSVISPDPYIMVDEIGVPTVFATKLTYPQPVTPWNVRQLRQAVINGPDKHPGAVLVQNEDGTFVKLNAKQRVQREAIAKQLLTPSVSFGKQKLKGKPKIVFRHLQTGDVLLLNRQPTLHKPSIMAHKARVLYGEKTLRLHYANCKSYNADFDGDEMNAHFPQSELGRSEAYNLASVVNNYLVPKDGTPLSGLIQDHMVSGVLLTIRGRFFNRSDYQNLVYGALTFLSRPFKLLPPAIHKPETLWSGKQVVSTIILNIITEGRSPPCLEGKAKIGVKSWQSCKSRPWTAGGTPLTGDDMSESQIIIRHGELLCGVLDKAHYGPTPYGLVHCCYEFYGGHISSVLLTSLARLFTHFLQSHIGFTLGIQDILVTEKANRKRFRIMRKARRVGDEAAAEALGVDDPNDKEVLRDKVEVAHRSIDDKPLKQMDMAMKSRTDNTNNSINKVCIPDGLIKKFPENNLQLMVNSGAKGATVNCMQISCLLGQIELEGRRVPLMMSGKTLPSFLAYDTSPRAGGFIDGRFLTGIRPQEFFFHCMAGREGLVDTAVKTSRSGYLQRCLIKHLEGLVVNYDLTVRDSDGSVIQFQYGEDGLDILKSQMIKSSLFPLLVNNYSAVVDNKHLEQLKEATDSDEIKEHHKNLRRWRKGNNQSSKDSQRESPFMHFANEHGDILQSFYQHDRKWEECKKDLYHLWFDLEDNQKLTYKRQFLQCPDPLNSCLQSDVHFGVVSEKLENLIQDYIDKNPHGLLKSKKKSKIKGKCGSSILSEKDFKHMMYFRAMKAICEPGEAVGLLAAQSVGEPSTQMTLNTFHFAGRGEMNVTLGIPRMREILMTGSANLATPSMDLPLRPVGPNLQQRAEAVKTILTNVSMAQVLQQVDIKERLVIKKAERHRLFHLKFQFLPYNLYKTKFAVDPPKILNYTETTFFKRLITAIKRKMKLLSETRRLSTQRSRSRPQFGKETSMTENQSNNVVLEEEDGGSSDDGEGDGDTTDARSRQRHDQDREYEEKEEEDIEAAKLGQDEEVYEEEEEEENVIKNENSDEDDEGDRYLESLKSSMTLEERKLRKEQQQAMFEKRQQFVLNSNNQIYSYDYDIKKELWCEVGLQLSVASGTLDLCSLVKEEAQKSIIHETPGIKRAFLVKDANSTNKDYDKMIKTDGVNFLEILKFDDIVDVNRVTSNDIHAIARTYGIEAATKTIVKEVSNVFGAYGIEVDPRHLMLIADYMTFDGNFRGCNRMGMEVNASPLQQMTFETTMHFLRSATLSGYEDHLKSPSSCLVVGHVVRSGTGCHELFQPHVKIM